MSVPAGPAPAASFPGPSGLRESGRRTALAASLQRLGRDTPNNLSCLSGYEGPQRFCKPQMLIIFSPFDHKKNMPEALRRRRRRRGCMDDNQGNKFISGRRRKSTWKITRPQSPACLAPQQPICCPHQTKTRQINSACVSACDEESPGTPKWSLNISGEGNLDCVNSIVI